MFFIFAALVSCQSASQSASFLESLPAECKKRLETVDNSQCGSVLFNLTTTGQLPQIQPAQLILQLNSELESFCSSECTGSLQQLAAELQSQECNDVSVNYANSTLTGQDLSTIPLPVQDLVCIKDANQYCLFNQLPQIISVVSGGVDEKTLSDPKVVCTTCLRKQSESLRGNFDEFSKGTIILTLGVQQVIGPSLKKVEQAQSTCNVKASSADKFGLYFGLGLCLLMF
jgi:hypothetical protein